MRSSFNNKTRQEKGSSLNTSIDLKMNRNLLGNTTNGNKLLHEISESKMMTGDRTSATINLLGNNMGRSKRGSVD